ncbi:MAG: aconitase X catalytic domain-containing protein [Thermoplasmata archaeon]
MDISKEEEIMLNGDLGEGTRMAMEIILKLGEYYGAKNTVKIENVQISGISYKNLGDYGIDLLKKFKDSKIKVPSYLNPISFDPDYIEFFTNNNEFIKGQMEILDIFKSLGAHLSLTCTPYYLFEPKLNDHIAWAESSAIVYANSVLGARTNRESGISALAAALTGRAANYGLHLDKGRRATVQVDFDFNPGFFDYAVIGLFLGSMIKNGIPYFRNLENNKDALKSLGAALNASGSIPMFHAENITPEYKDAIQEKIEKLIISKDEINNFRLSITANMDPDVVMIGCPHLSHEELKNISAFIKKRKVKNGRDLIFFTSRKVREESMDYVNIIKNSGAKIFTDTCMVVSPLQERYSVVGLNSGKATYYVGKERKVFFSDMVTLMEMVTDEN